MNHRIPALTASVHTCFRITVGLLGVFLVLWIGMGGFVAVLVEPYLIAALWLVGILGLFGCVAAFLNTLPDPERDGFVPHPFRALACLSAAAAMGSALWVQALPALAGKPMGLDLLEFSLVGGVVLGTLLLVLLTLLVVLGTGEKAESPERLKREAPRVVDLTGQETAA